MLAILIHAHTVKKVNYILYLIHDKLLSNVSESTRLDSMVFQFEREEVILIYHLKGVIFVLFPFLYILYI